MTIAQRQAVLKKAREFAQASHYDAGHTGQVTRLALALFDALAPLHKRGSHERFLLECAALLHDIGWVAGRVGHHKQSMRMILDNPDASGLADRDRRIVANVARYHRRALPQAKHKAYRALDADGQAVVRMLAGILRVADGLDVRHLGCVEATVEKCRWDDKQLILVCHTRSEAGPEAESAKAKADLLEQELGRTLVIELVARDASR